MSKYVGVDSYALQAFKGCHNRVRDGKCPSIAWPRTREGYIEFCAEIGLHPLGMAKPSVGRIDHRKGYEPGNIQWEEHRVNSVKRKGTKFESETSPVVCFRSFKFRKGTEGHRVHQAQAASKRWSDPVQKIEMSNRMKGNQHARISR